MIKQMAVLIDLLFFVVALYLLGYNFLYLAGMKKTRDYTGFSLPTKIVQAMRINVLLSVAALCMIGAIAVFR